MPTFTAIIYGVGVLRNSSARSAPSRSHCGGVASHATMYQMETPQPPQAGLRSSVCLNPSGRIPNKNRSSSYSGLLPKLATWLLFLFCLASHAQGASCIEQAQTQREVTKCGQLLIEPLDAIVDAEFQRLTNKYKDNKEQLDMLKSINHDWKGYWNNQCMFEGLAASGEYGETDRELPLNASKAFVSCVHRILLERHVALSKL